MVPQLALPEGGEWIVILVIVVLLFGAKKLPELTRNAARAMKEFEKARHEDDETPAELAAPQQAQAQPQTAPSQAAQPQVPVAQPQAPVTQPQAPAAQTQTQAPAAQPQTQAPAAQPQTQPPATAPQAGQAERPQDGDGVSSAG